MRRPTFTPRERAMIDRFRRELPEIIASRDPYRPEIMQGGPANGVQFENRICAQDGCSFYVFHDRFCRAHYTAHRAAERAAKVTAE